jgi:hypothetical protein
MNYDEMKVTELKREIKARGLEICYLSGLNRKEALEILWRDDQGQGIDAIHKQKCPRKMRESKFWWKRATLTIPAGTRVYLAESGNPIELTRKLRTQAKIACSRNGARYANESWMFTLGKQMYHLRPTGTFGVLIEDESIVSGT